MDGAQGDLVQAGVGRSIPAAMWGGPMIANAADVLYNSKHAEANGCCFAGLVCGFSRGIWDWRWFFC